MPSSVIKGMRYQPERRELDIAFRGARGMYRYLDVPPKEWSAFCSAPSKGTYLNEIFKAKRYRYERMQARSRRGTQLAGQAHDETKFVYWGEAGAFGEAYITT